MASPIIDSIVAVPSTVFPRGAFVVTITAHDPDQQVGTLTGVVTDAAGNQNTAMVQITISDPLTYQLLDQGNNGFTITSRAGQPGVFDCVAP